MTKPGGRRDRAAREAWQAMADLVLNNERRREVSEEVGLSFGKDPGPSAHRQAADADVGVGLPARRRSAQPDARGGRPRTSRTGRAPATSDRPTGEARRGDARRERRWPTRPTRSWPGRRPASPRSPPTELESLVRILAQVAAGQNPTPDY